MQESIPEVNVLAIVAHYINLAQLRLIMNAFKILSAGMDVS